MLINKKLAFLVILIALFLPALSSAQDNSAANEPINDAQNIPPQAFYTGIITAIPDSRALGTGADAQLFQTVTVKILSGDMKDQTVTIQNVGGASVNGGKGFRVGEKIVISKTVTDGETAYYVEDLYRLPGLWIVTGIFLAIIIIFGRWRGISSVIGLAISIGVILKYLAPQILAGKNPLVISLISAAIIALVSIYLAHGFNKRTTIAVVSTFLTLGLALGMAVGFVHLVSLFGNGSEESVYLQVDQTHHINLQGLLLGGIILGALGVLDDITTAQSATVDELKKANPSFSMWHLYKSASSVGREHISSLINTLFLAYAGVSLPLFLLFQVIGGQPVWTVLNSEFISEEIVRTLVGSITLIIAVPITTLLASYFFSKTGPSKSAESAHIH